MNYIEREVLAGYRTTVGALKHHLVSHNTQTAFIGQVERFTGLFLICSQGVFPAGHPEVVFYADSREVLVDRFVDVNITTRS